MYPARPIEERLASRTEIDATTGCHIWKGPTTSDGYGRISSNGGKKVLRTHRVAYEAAKGPIPDGLQLDHLCRNRACCNPNHLEAVTCRENTLRSRNPPAKNAAKTHCKHGHALAGENLQVDPQGARRCKACQRRRALQAYYAGGREVRRARNAAALAARRNPS